MGAYLASPKTDKISTDEMNDFLMVGASSMQGWRNSQEDAHNSILKYDTNTSFFAVYDGHGGAEVATYCAENLPQFLRDLPSYRDGNLEKALKDAFLGFDKLLLEPNVIEVLKYLAGEKNYVEEAGDDEEDVEDLMELREEGALPLNEVLERYRSASGNRLNEDGNLNLPHLDKLRDSEPRPSGSKPQSPALRGRRGTATIVATATATDTTQDKNSKKLETSETSAASSSSSPSSNANAAISTTTSKMDTDPEEDSTVSSSSSSTTITTAGKGNLSSEVVSNTTCEAAGVEAESSVSNKTNAMNGEVYFSADSSIVKDIEQNGVSCSEPVNKSSKSIEGVSSSSSKQQTTTLVASTDVSQSVKDSEVSRSNDTSTKQVNGEVSSPTSISSTSLSSTATVKKSSSGISSSTSAKLVREIVGGGGRMPDDDDGDGDDDDDGDDDSSTDSDIDFQAEETSSTDESGPKILDSSEDGDDEDEDEDDESALANAQFCDNMVEEPGKDSGCTAVLALLRGRDLYVANAGDSRCVVCRDGRAIDMSLDHKPEDDEESERILKAGGRVTLDGRVNGGLNLSRAIGDHAYKMNADLPAEEQMISALPDIKKLIISPNDEFMVLACDGIWNFMSSEEVVDFVRQRLQDENKTLSKICEELFDNCLAPDTLGDGTGCDNMTAVIVRFKPKILELATSINPSETEDVLLSQRAVESDLADANLQLILKRSASTLMDNDNEAENSNKRIKTDHESSKEATEMAQDNDSGVVASSSSSTSVSNKVE